MNQSLNALVLRHSNFTGSLRVGVIVIGVIGSSVLPTVKVLVADGLAIVFIRKESYLKFAIINI